MQTILLTLAVTSAIELAFTDHLVLAHGLARRATVTDEFKGYRRQDDGTASRRIGRCRASVGGRNNALFSPPEPTESNHQAVSITCRTALVRSNLCHKLLSVKPPRSIVIPCLSPATPDHDTVSILSRRLEFHLPIGIRQIISTLGARAGVVLRP
jgi:hypothetical protein